MDEGTTRTRSIPRPPRFAHTSAAEQSTIPAAFSHQMLDRHRHECRQGQGRPTGRRGFSVEWREFGDNIGEGADLTSFPERGNFGETVHADREEVSDVFGHCRNRHEDA